MIKYNYKDYWKGKFEEREKERYYERIYGGGKKFYKFDKNDKILDIGGGNGHFSYFIGAKNVTIIDISDSGLKFAKKKFGYHIIKNELLKRWNVKDGYFDLAFCTEALEHLRYPSLVIAEAYRVLKNNGILYIGQINMKPDGVHHLKKIHFKYLKRLLKKNGFVIEDYIIMPGFITNKLSNIKKFKTKSLRKKIIIIIGSLMRIIIPQSIKLILAYKIPYIFGGFYHVKARKK